jgi:hypothetical protein
MLLEIDAQRMPPHLGAKSSFFFVQLCSILGYLRLFTMALIDLIFGGVPCFSAI